ncbi:hypothetical protein D0T53_08525 [Dysgonomonas sp. 216]|uniref:RICIN domain-containing protein n=1 Tax=Dysgonomonas sp. 216 TaxID=2302934 RepID=UPI0013D58066|nr:RICIN domain-containing protein [Dysgonomonas sp. 216]NDW18953.1 hypothetical protein [Dysgonomonas sp. 216]
MKKILSLFSCALLSSGLFAQTLTVNKTFDPVDDQVYLIKSQSTDKGRNNSYLIETETAEGKVLQITNMTTAEATANEAAQWIIKYEEAKGYTIQNKNTGNLFQYNGPEVLADESLKYTGKNKIAPAVEPAAMDTSYYFELLKSNAVFKLGNKEFPFQTQGYLVRAPYSPSTSTKPQCLDAWDAEEAGVTWGIGTWTFDSNSKVNHIWWFVTPEEAALFDAALVVGDGFAFIPEGDGVYYIKSHDEAKGRNTHFMVDADDSDTISFVAMSNAEVKLNDNAKWKISMDYTTGYELKNVATGRSIRYEGNYEATDAAEYRGANFFKLGDKSADSEPERYAISVKARLAEVFIGLKDADGNVVESIKSFTMQPYTLIATNSVGNQAMDLYGTANVPDTWKMGSYDDWGGVNQNWWLVQDQDLTAYEDAKAETVFTPKEMTKYRFRPRNFTTTVPEELGMTQEEFEEEKLNCRLTDAGGSVFMTKFEKDEVAQMWEFEEAGDGYYYIVNSDTYQFMAVQKWETSVDDERYNLSLNALTTNNWSDYMVQFMSLKLLFVEYLQNENGNYEKAYAILNDNVTDGVQSTTNFLVDVWTEPYADNQVGTYSQWKVPAGPAQTFVIREVAEDGSEIVPDITSIEDVTVSGSDVKVYGANGSIIVNSEYPVTTTVYTMTGMFVKQTKDSSIPVASGFYIAKVGNTAFKVYVK